LLYGVQVVVTLRTCYGALQIVVLVLLLTALVACRHIGINTALRTWQLCCTLHWLFVYAS